ncbi:hypothetical protein Rrhod_2710 [Rhodococcus rhodnii LMG 5362]|uniref:Uncharacterized protein n=1 Tax=Rhodococcus rhodnii LMG 5362 TaxID=1273125 RepID=R7WKW8_9NOCA|nr:hypothetical protein Rrhod_2710 [Rhodococcus rhodnii LMG 5362]
MGRQALEALEGAGINVPTPDGFTSTETGKIPSVLF